MGCACRGYPAFAPFVFLLAYSHSEYMQIERRLKPVDATIINDIRAARLKIHTEEFEQSDKYKSVDQQDQLDLID